MDSTHHEYLRASAPDYERKRLARIEARIAKASRENIRDRIGRILTVFSALGFTAWLSFALGHDYALGLL